MKIIMSWSNPSADEAAEAYFYYKKIYDAARKKQIFQKNEQSYASQKESATSQMNSLSSQKVNIEEQLSEIEKRIKMFEDNDGWFSENVPDGVSKATPAQSETEISYKNSIKMTGGVAAAGLEDAFETKTVEGDNHSATALQQYKSEKTRLEQEIANLKAQIASLSNTISDFTSKINSCNATQESLQAVMNSCAYEMNHYKKYMG